MRQPTSPILGYGVFMTAAMPTRRAEQLNDAHPILTLGQCPSQFHSLELIPWWWWALVRSASIMPIPVTTGNVGGALQQLAPAKWHGSLCVLLCSLCSVPSMQGVPKAHAWMQHLAHAAVSLGGSAFSGAVEQLSRCPSLQAHLSMPCWTAWPSSASISTRTGEARCSLLMFSCSCCCLAGLGPLLACPSCCVPLPAAYP